MHLNRFNVLAAAAALISMAPLVTYDGGHQTGPGERKSPARGVYSPPPKVHRKEKSKSLQKLLRK